jgi:hypothetical protein
MWRRVVLVWTDVSEERIASVFRVDKSAKEEPAWAGDCRLSSRTMTLGSIQPLTRMSTRNFPGDEEAIARRADNLAAVYEPNVWKYVSLNLSQPQGPARPAQRILYLTLLPFHYILSIWYDTDSIENTLSNNVFSDRCLATIGEDTETHRQQGDLISLLLFLQNKESRKKPQEISSCSVCSLSSKLELKSSTCKWLRFFALLFSLRSISNLHFSEV